MSASSSPAPSSSFSLPRSAPHRRVSPFQSRNDSTIAVDQAPPPPPPSPPSQPRTRALGIFQFLGFGFIICLGFLQLYLPATHFRDASDPFRKWVPFNSNLSSSAASTTSRASSDENSDYRGTHPVEDGMVHVVSWMDCLDLRVLAVLVNSTLSCSRYPDLVSFHFFTAEGQDDKVSYYKLKVLFPHTNLEILGQEKVKERIVTAYSVGEYHGPSFDEIAPFVIPTVHPTLSKFIYVSPNVIIKGQVEELLVNSKDFGIAVADDCSKRLSTYISFDVLDAIQRSAAKPWVSGTPYSKDACMPYQSLVFIDSTRLEKDLLEAIIWWSRVLDKSERGSPNPAVALALYDRHLKLDINYESLILQYDWGRNINSESCGGAVRRPDLEKLWRQYLPPMSYQILGN